MKKLCVSIVALIAGLSILSAQTGTVAGKVVEAESGFEVIGGSILVVGTDFGTVTDLDGTYKLDLAPGTYTLEFSYVGFASQQFNDVVITANNLTSLDVQLAEEAINLDVDITVKARSVKNTETALLTIQRKAPVVLDGISSAQISKSGDSDVASAVRRVTGVTVEGGKYVYVRGLGDRYSKTTLNAAEVPGLDPNRNTVQMDLFPTNLIDNILVYKTFSPNLPGDFTGGYVDIATKDFPEQFTFNVSGSLGYNTLSTFNKDNYLTSPGSKTDWLGFDDGSRDIPEEVQNTTPFPEFAQGNSNPAIAQQIAGLTRSFNNNWEQYHESPFLNHSLSLSLGNQKELFGKPLGLIFATSYSRNFSAYSGGEYGIFELTGPVATTDNLTSQLELEENKGADEVLWGAMLSSSYKLSGNHKIGLTLMHNQSGALETRYLEGRKNRDDPDDLFVTRTWAYKQRSLSTGQLRGKHVLSGLNNFEISWQSSYSLSMQDEPDLRYFTMRQRPSGNYIIKLSSDNVPNRFYRNMEQYNFDNKLDFTLPFKQWSGQSSALKFGGAYVVRSREFRENRYTFNNQVFLVENGDPYAYFFDDNLIQATDGGFVKNPQTGNVEGVYVTNSFDPANNYDAQQYVTAAYGMVELPLSRKLRAIVGARMEQTIVRLKTFDTLVALMNFPFLDGEQDLLKETDILPSLNLNYDLTERMKLRLAYTRTLARPTFREVAPFASFDVDGGFLFIGNPNLERTLVDNVDFRWEFYPKPSEMISLSAFYKDFTNPIERTFNPQAPNTVLTFSNVAQASLYGAEVEVRKDLSFLGQFLSDFSLGANFSYVISETDIEADELALIRSLDPEAEGTREMFGQAPWVVNGLLSYKNEGGTQANLSFNMVGPRITVVTRGASPDYYQQPLPLMNFNVSQTFGNGFAVKASANNLLNGKYRETAEYKGEEYSIIQYELGRTFSLGLSYNLSK